MNRGIQLDNNENNKWYEVVVDYGGQYPYQTSIYTNSIENAKKYAVDECMDSGMPAEVDSSWVRVVSCEEIVDTNTVL